jgi:hypothetical protein
MTHSVFPFRTEQTVSNLPKDKNAFHADHKSKKTNNKLDIAASIVAEKEKDVLRLDWYLFSLFISYLRIIQLNQKPFLNVDSVVHAKRFYDWIEKSSTDDLQTIVDEMISIVDDKEKDIYDLVKYFEEKHCNLPFDYKLIVKARVDTGEASIKTSVHFAECPLGPVAGMQDGGGGIGENASFFGRFHNRIHRYLVQGIYKPF